MIRLLDSKAIEIFVSRHVRRRKVFIASGLPEDKAFELADELWDRDLDSMKDRRRVCFECEFHNGNRCRRNADKFNPFVLQVCNKFHIKGR